MSSPNMCYKWNAPSAEDLKETLMKKYLPISDQQNRHLNHCPEKRMRYILWDLNTEGDFRHHPKVRRIKSTTSMNILTNDVILFSSVCCIICKCLNNWIDFLTMSFADPLLFILQCINLCQQHSNITEKGKHLENITGTQIVQEKMKFVPTDNEQMPQKGESDILKKFFKRDCGLYLLAKWQCG